MSSGLFLLGQPFQPDDLTLTVTRPGGGLVDPIYIRYALFRLSASTPNPILVGANNRTPLRRDVGQYYAAGIAGDGGQPGDWYIEWRLQLSTSHPLTSRRMDFKVITGVAPPNTVLSPALPFSPVAPAPNISPDLEQQVTLAENGSPGDTVVIPHAFGHAPVVYVLKQVGSTWVDATGTVDIFHNSTFTSVTVTNTTNVTLTFLVRLSPQ